MFSVDPNRVKLESTNTTRVANTSPSAASSTADLNGKALELACKTILKRLLLSAANSFGVDKKSVYLMDEYIFVNGKKANMHWCELVDQAFLERICLTENGHYATPKIHFDKTIEKGHPFAYHVFGMAMTEVTVDCLDGSYDIDAVKIIHDFGKSMNLDIDMGQIEGGLVQGIGWMTMEDLQYNARGKLISNALSNYKIPDIYSVPKEIVVFPLETEGSELAIRKSKAVGEPPLMYGIGTYFAIRDAIMAFNKTQKHIYDAPYTHEKILMDLYSNS